MNIDTQKRSGNILFCIKGAVSSCLAPSRIIAISKPKVAKIPIMKT